MEKYASVSCIQPMFHFWLNPRPPASAGRVTPPQAVDSSAMVSTPGTSRCTTVFSSWRKAIVSRFSRPPWRLGTHSPSSRE